MVKIIIKWFICPVLIGLIPTFIRIGLWYFLNEKTIELFDTSDLITFGLILNIHNITQRKYLNDPESLWSQIQIVTPIFLIIFYTLCLYIDLSDQAKTNQFNVNALKMFSAILGGGSLVVIQC